MIYIILLVMMTIMFMDTALSKNVELVSLFYVTPRDDRSDTLMTIEIIIILLCLMAIFCLYLVTMTMLKEAIMIVTGESNLSKSRRSERVMTFTGVVICVC